LTQKISIFLVKIKFLLFSCRFVTFDSFGKTGVFLTIDLKTCWKDDNIIKYLPNILSSYGLMKKIEANTSKTLVPSYFVQLNSLCMILENDK
jgi:hypothetical protein